MKSQSYAQQFVAAARHYTMKRLANQAAWLVTPFLLLVILAAYEVVRWIWTAATLPVYVSVVLTLLIGWIGIWPLKVIVSDSIYLYLLKRAAQSQEGKTDD